MDVCYVTVHPLIKVDEGGLGALSWIGVSVLML